MQCAFLDDIKMLVHGNILITSFVTVVLHSCSIGKILLCDDVIFMGVYVYVGLS